MEWSAEERKTILANARKIVIEEINNMPDDIDSIFRERFFICSVILFHLRRKIEIKEENES